MRALIAGQRFHVHAPEKVFASGGGIQSTRVFMAVDLPEPLGAHDGDEVAGLNI